MKRIDIIGLNGNDGLHYKKVTMMTLDDINRLQTALTLQDGSHYHGDILEGLQDALKELDEMKQCLQGLPEAPNFDTVCDVYEQVHGVLSIMKPEGDNNE